MTSDKSYTTEQRLNDMVTLGWAVPLYAWKPADEPRDSTTSFAQDVDLTITLPPADDTQRWEMWGIIGYYGGSGSFEGDFKWRFGTAGGSLRYAARYRDPGGNWRDGAWLHGGDSNTAITTGITDELIVEVAAGHLYGVPAAGGDFYLDWAQGSSNSTPTRVMGGSYIALRRME